MIYNKIDYLRMKRTKILKLNFIIIWVIFSKYELQFFLQFFQIWAVFEYSSYLKKL